MASSRTYLKITLVIAALMITTTVVATSPIESKNMTVKWTWNGASTVNAGYPVLSPNGDLLTYSTNGSVATVYAISPEGKSLWNIQSPLSDTPRFGADGTIYLLVEVLSTSVVNGTGVAALTPNGVLKWTYMIPGVSEGMKILPDGGAVLGAVPVYPGQHSLICLNSDGSVRWTTGAYEANASLMVYPVGIHGNNVMVASTSLSSPAASVVTEYAPDGKVVRSFHTAFAPAKIFFAPDGSMRTVGYNFTRSTDYEYLYALNSDGSYKWSAILNSAYGDLAVLPDGTTVYAEKASTTSSVLDLYAVDANGNSLWRGGNGRTIPVAYGNGFLFANSTALMQLDRDGKIMWKLDGNFHGQPVTDGKTIYIGSGSDLVAVSESAWKVTWQPAVVVITVMFAMIAVALMGGTTPKLK